MKKTNRPVRVADLKARLSEYLRQVKSGRELVVTERGRPIAVIAPIRGAMAQATRVEDLIASGAARGPVAPLDVNVLRGERPLDSSSRLLQILLEERAEGR